MTQATTPLSTQAYNAAAYTCETIAMGGSTTLSFLGNAIYSAINDTTAGKVTIGSVSVCLLSLGVVGGAAYALYQVAVSFFNGSKPSEPVEKEGETEARSVAGADLSEPAGRAIPAEGSVGSADAGRAIPASPAEGSVGSADAGRAASAPAEIADL